jgi:hypothetical protein
MEYLVGFWLALTTLSVISWSFSKRKYENSDQKFAPIRYSQSHVHNLVSPLLPPISSFKKVVVSQSTKHESNTNIKVIIMDNSAYWIKDNTFYVAEMDDNGTVNKETTRQVDTMDMSKVQLDQMLFIMDRLREGLYDDSGGSGNQ